MRNRMIELNGKNYLLATRNEIQENHIASPRCLVLVKKETKDDVEHHKDLGNRCDDDV